MKEQITALYNEVARLRELVPGGSFDGEEALPSYGADVLLQEREQLTSVRNEYVVSSSNTYRVLM